MTLDELAVHIKATKVSDLFAGANPGRIKAKLEAICHPDRNPGDKKAETLFKMVGELWDHFQNPPPPTKSPKRSYQTECIIGVGDVSDVHLASGTGNSYHLAGVLCTDPPKDYVLKISRVPGGEVLLKNEATNLADILTYIGDKKYGLYLPTLVENFPAKDKIQKHINVFTYESGYYDFEKVHTQHPSLDGRHLAWIFRRLLTVLGAVHRSGYLHGALLPPHLMIYPGMAGQKDDKAHALMLVGWGHSIRYDKEKNAGDTIKTISAKHRLWYPREVFDKKPASAETDLYMAAKCMLYLAGGDLETNTFPDSTPKSMRRFFGSMLAEGQRMRPNDAWNLEEEFKDLLKKLYGPPKFHNLVMSPV